ncbi:DNA damage-inducible protein 1 [Pichia californica]|uniref:DNA damage-inducible protein 1 n=1 Tax=Pichia californica TaxID=460514 RepID=A0A9P6WRJ1_9ASCO|nr:DNA damage-inducible protein 1 [[Candida] californica]KAG0691028.1 DNA damage-inducible protein 1 [[Candida] californica]
MQLTFNYNNQFFGADLPPSMTLADMAAYIEAETGLPPTHQTLMHKYIQLSPSNVTTLENSNIVSGDMIVIVPFDPVANNLNQAYEENPEFFADVTMLYIKISINGQELPAFVDTGAQRSLITPQLCEKCDLNHLIDRRFKMQARGVGSKQSEGRIHSVPMNISGELCATSLTVLDIGGVGLLIGLDWMKRFRIQIDLEKNGLVIDGKLVPFLNEWEVKKLQEANDIHPDSDIFNQNNENPVTNNKPSPTKTSSSLKPTPVSRPAIPTPISTPNPTTTANANAALTSDQQTKLNNLIEMGFDKKSSLNALQQCGWNVDMAAGLLF